MAVRELLFKKLHKRNALIIYLWSLLSSRWPLHLSRDRELYTTSWPEPSLCKTMVSSGGFAIKGKFPPAGNIQHKPKNC